MGVGEKVLASREHSLNSCRGSWSTQVVQHHAMKVQIDKSVVVPPDEGVLDILNHNTKVVIKLIRARSSCDREIAEVHEVVATVSSDSGGFQYGHNLVVV